MGEAQSLILGKGIYNPAAIAARASVAIAHSAADTFAFCPLAFTYALIPVSWLYPFAAVCLRHHIPQFAGYGLNLHAPGPIPSCDGPHGY